MQEINTKPTVASFVSICCPTFHWSRPCGWSLYS